MGNPIIQLERFLLRNSRECSAILGVGYTSYLHMKSGARAIPHYVENHIRTLLALDAQHINLVVRERLSGR